MITFDARRISATTSSIDVEVIVTSSSGRNLHSVSVFASDGSMLLDTTLGCGSPLFRNIISGIPRANLPIIIRVSECDDAGNPTGTSASVPFLGEERPQGGGGVICPPPSSTVQTSPPPPENQACREAQAGVQRLRNQIIENCTELNRLIANRNVYLAIAAAFFALATAAAIASAFVPYFFRIILFVAAAVFAAIALGFSIAAAVVLGQIAAAAERDRTLREDFRQRVAGLSRVCCPEHLHVDQNEPAC